MRSLVLFSILIFFSGQLFAKVGAPALDLDDVKSWDQFKIMEQRQEAFDAENGTAYLISGSLLVLGGLVGYNNADGSVQKLAYTAAQSIGVAGIGYGAYLHYVGSEQQTFFESVENSKTLSIDNKNELVRNYISITEQNRHNEKLIRIISHSIVAAMNIYSATREQGDLRQGLFALGGVNLLAAISISFQ